MSEFLVEEAQHGLGVSIKIIGCGGGGGNMINHMIKMGLNDLDLIVANTDAQDLASSLAKTKIQLGEKKTRGRGAGMVPEVGAESARENFEELKASLAQSDIVFIASGLGGGTGTGATPIIAQAAKEVGALTVSVVTMPFKFEGKPRTRLAEVGLEELKKESDSILVIQNEKLLSLIDKKASMKDSFKVVDDVLTNAVRGMVSILLNNGDINVDFADVKTVMSHRGLALMGIGSAKGENAVNEAISNAIESPLLDGMDIKGAKGVILHFKTSSNCSFFEIAHAAEGVQELVDENAKIIFGTTTDDTMEDNVEVTIIATGFENRASQANMEKASEEKQNAKNPYINIKKVSGGYDEEMMSQLETPAFLRRQMD
ncbi:MULTISPECIES: cell division protein FtsZ [unclassified Campylobacter]|uniref:cell division protein FtsZ n=1 Tax=unclassified Campylobacter TaxID=2593542 RepID=UPI001237CB08|nr:MULTISPECIES: cell division protein FtsZ [unclassified Campylobacter]KAA6228463.1 cell division protein FtsZ [Campylobacter sp. LR185c]KAA6228949.1 cell division protein FtsZ [Campylobacter sp. LR196d]KAA6229435.1 cell division protein FtsZ [Campylobacter sp. LR286c]KAA6229901.1 cell division protein FtsZ [Campylobacter sp. LR264d]KAA6234114.1 cell division protein FtsZ [Campylobacter sp. LR291e]